MSYDADFNTTVESATVVPTLNQVWLTAFLNPVPGYLSILDLNNSRVFRPTLTGPAAHLLVNPNGGYYHSGLVYLSSFGDPKTSPTIVTIDPFTYGTIETVNSFYGLPLNGSNDIAVATSRTTAQPSLFYSDFYFAAEGLPGVWSAPQQLPNAVYRFQPTEQSLAMVISPLDVQTANGLAVDKNNTVLYVTEGPDSAVFGQSTTNRLAPQVSTSSISEVEMNVHL
ncbi:hypothetical protein LTR64_001770 [Lithohypha guttulata]|uniref:uncharacterized protein n=1 Tax=Lithohypha guttulata TaxID=1690604 RepID=UPI002DDE7CAA|nr:hypothetical protein LTR51_003964 [Lithohypha guttulata]